MMVLWRNYYTVCVAAVRCSGSESILSLQPNRRASVLAIHRAWHRQTLIKHKDTH